MAYCPSCYHFFMTKIYNYAKICNNTIKLWIIHEIFGLDGVAPQSLLLLGLLEYEKITKFAKRTDKFCDLPTKLLSGSVTPSHPPPP